MMKPTTGTIFTVAIAFCLVALAAIFGGGCGGDDDNCMSVENCPDTDAGPMTADADPTAPDADTTPDANNDVCADYRWMADKPWHCYGGGGSNIICSLEMFPAGGVCGIQCAESFWLGVDDPALTISRTPPPPALHYSAGSLQIDCYQDL